MRQRTRRSLLVAVPTGSMAILALGALVAGAGGWWTELAYGTASMVCLAALVFGIALPLSLRAVLGLTDEVTRERARRSLMGRWLAGLHED